MDQFSPSAATLDIETLRLYPGWLALLSRHMQVHFEGRLYSGRLEGEARYLTVEGAPVWDIKTRLTDLDVAQHALLRQDGRAFLRGQLGGDAVTTLASDGHIQEGIFNLRMQAVALTSIPGWQVQLPREIACDTLQGELKALAKQASMVALTCQGKDLFIEARGSVAWKIPLPDSQLNLRWQVRSDEAYKQELDLLANILRKRPDRRGELSFRLQGPLRQLRTGA
jgi:type II secretion system protein N